MDNSKILIIDDSKASLRFIRMEIEAGDYQVLEAESGEQALDMLHKHDIALITLDVDMPGMDGFETCKKIREAELSRMDANPIEAEDFIPVIFLTAFDTLESRAKGFTAGGKEFLGKHFANGELLNLINKTLHPHKALAGLNVIVADESRITRQLTTSHLTSQGVKVKEFQDGKSAFEYLIAQGDKVDLLISDFELKQMNGLELCKKVRKELGLKLPIIIVSAHCDRETMLKFFQIGATDYLIKPYLKEELIVRLNSHLENRMLTKHLVRHNLELKAINQLKDRFLSACSHDLRSPLNAILGFTDLLKTDLEGNPQHIKFLEKIEESGQSLMEYVDELLDFTNFQINKNSQVLSEVDMLQVLKQCIPELEVIAKQKSIKIISHEINISHANILGAATDLKRLIHNLVTNAIKFSNQGSTVTIKIEDENGKLVLSVEDCGIGIPKTHLDQIFTESFNFNRPGTLGEKSTGFGLNIIKDIVDKHEASIKVISEEKEGTIFMVTFANLKISESNAA